jgi:hypothetical protein
MTVADTLRKICAAAEPYIEQQLDVAEALAEIREKASEEGIDWSQAKALLVARARDARDGGERVEKLIRKADNAAAYAAMLERPNVAEKHESRTQSEVPRETQSAAGSRTGSGEAASATTPPLPSQAASSSSQSAAVEISLEPSAGGGEPAPPENVTRLRVPVGGAGSSVSHLISDDLCIPESLRRY